MADSTPPQSLNRPIEAPRFPRCWRLPTRPDAWRHLAGTITQHHIFSQRPTCAKVFGCTSSGSAAISDQRPCLAQPLRTDRAPLPMPPSIKGIPPAGVIDGG
ncbi:hypothetical protein [Hydrogenophaga sp.]|uniref:hypothetical protein n=1 Tax=Hydrogenophaga sp. TaxID=1904254 RepID=UPI0027357C36|nr:hypothetical protein [Hydrogenophaga sp.]